MSTKYLKHPIEIHIPADSRYWSMIRRGHRAEQYPAKCAVCGEPATVVDYHFPYYSDKNRCEEHKEANNANT
jgi:hypothetical protein